MTTLKACLKRARESLAGGKYTDAIQHCQAALQHDSDSYDAHVFLGKACFLSGDCTRAEASYREALGLQKDALPAWKGLAELYSSTGSTAADARETFEQLLELSSESEDRRAAYRESLAKCYIAESRPIEALLLLEQLPEASHNRPENLALTADAQASLPLEDAGRQSLKTTLERLQASTAGNPIYAKHHAMYAQQLWTLWCEAEWDPAVHREALAACRELCRKCTAPEPIIVCLRLLEYADTDSKMTKKDALALTMQLAHQSPFSPAAPIALASALHDQQIASGEAPSTHQERSLIIQMYEHGSMDKAGLMSAWLSKARVQHDNRDFQGAKQTAAAALAASRSSAMPSASDAVCTELILTQSCCDLELGNTATACQGFRRIAGSVASAEGPITGALDRTALLGLAACALRSGDTAEALRLCERALGRQQRSAAPSPLAAFEHLLGSAAVRGAKVAQPQEPEAEDWAHAEYGWALYKAGRLQEARTQLDTAVQRLETAGFETPDWAAAQHQWRLGQVFWELGDAHHDAAKAAWMQAIAVEGPCQALAYASLGGYYQRQAKGAGAARKCFQRALAIDPCLAAAGNGLMRGLRRAGAAEAAAELCEDIAEQYPGASWAQRQLGFLAMAGGRAEDAVKALQAALGGDPADAPAWEALGAAYHMLGRLTAALKAFTRSVDLDSSRLYSRVQCGHIRLALGGHPEAVAAFEAALEQRPGFGPACEGAAAALLAAARSHQSSGAPGMAADDLARAEAFMHIALSGASCKSEAGLKLLGDIKLAYHAAGTGLAQGTDESSIVHAVESIFSSWKGRIKSVQQARQAYAKAMHVKPDRAAAWGDAASAFYIEAQLRRSHACMRLGDGTALVQASERCIRGGLRLDPADADLWACLGACASSDSVREYALGRALALDPKRAPCWAALGRLYAEAGHTGLADRCLIAARSHDPSSAAAWEAMGTLASFSAQGADREAYYQEAVKLGGGVEAQLGFAEGACKRAAPSAAAYVAARRAVESDPLNAAARNALGLATEARGSTPEATRQFELAAHLSGTSSGGARDVISISVPDQQGQPSLPVSARLNQARVLIGSQPGEAAALYSQLNSGGHLSFSSEAKLAYAHALAAQGQWHDAADVLHAAKAAAESSQVQVACMQALLKVCVQLEDTGGFFSLLDEHQELLLEAPAAAVQDLWLTVQAAAALPALAGFEHELVQRLQTWQALRGDVDASFTAKLLTLRGDRARLSGDELGASRCLAQSLHQSPSQPEVWMRLAAMKAYDESKFTSIASKIACKMGAGALAESETEALSSCICAALRHTELLSQLKATSKALHLWPSAGRCGRVH